MPGRVLIAVSSVILKVTCKACDDIYKGRDQKQMYLVSLQVQSVVDKADTACRPSMQCRVDARVNDGRMDPTIANSKDVLILFCKYLF